MVEGQATPKTRGRSKSADPATKSEESPPKKQKKESTPKKDTPAKAQSPARYCSVSCLVLIVKFLPFNVFSSRCENNLCSHDVVMAEMDLSQGSGDVPQKPKGKCDDGKEDEPTI